MKEDKQIIKMLRELETIDEKDYLKKEIITSKFTTHNGIETTWNFKKIVTNDINSSRIIISIEATRADCSPNGRDLKVWEYNGSSSAPSIKIYNKYDDETGKYTDWFIPTAKENYELVNKKYVDNIFARKINDFKGSIDLDDSSFFINSDNKIETVSKTDVIIDTIEYIEPIEKINSFKDSTELSENTFRVNDEGEIETIINDDTIKELDHKFVKRKYQTTYVNDDKNYDVDKVFISNSNSHYIDIKNKWTNADDDTDIRETRLHIVAKDGEILGVNTDDGNDKNTHTPVNVISASALTTKSYVDTQVAASGGVGSGIFKDGVLVPEVNWGDKISPGDDIIANKQEFVIKQHYSDADSVTIKIHDQRISATKDDKLNQPIVCELNSDLVTKYYMDKADKKIMDRITALENSLLPIGTIIISLTAPSIGTWSDLGVLANGQSIIGGDSTNGSSQFHFHYYTLASSSSVKAMAGDDHTMTKFGDNTTEGFGTDNKNRAWGIGLGSGMHVWKRIS